MSFPLLLSLSYMACNIDDKDDDTSVSDSSHDDTATPDTGGDAASFCAGRPHDMVFESSEEASRPWPAVTLIVEVQSLATSLVDIALYIESLEDLPCMSVSEDASTGSRTYEGDCEFEGVEFSGHMTEIEAENGASYTFQDVIAYHGTSYAASGRFAWSQEDEALVLDADIEISYDYNEGFGPIAWAMVGQGVIAEDYSNATGWVQTENDGLFTTHAGSFCVVDEIEDSATCASEGVGVRRVLGASEWIFTQNGEMACDECVDVSLDGVAQDPYCW